MGKRTTGILPALSLALALSACALGVGDGVNPAIYDLGGEWAGWFEDDVGVDHDFSMSIDRSGRVTAFYVDFDLQPYTAVVKQSTAEGFQILFSTGGGAVMVVDDVSSHGVYFDANGGFGVLQKSPPVSWSYLFTNPVGDWSGFAYIYESSAGGFAKYAPWDMTITDGGATLPFAGIDDLNTPFSGAITSHSSYFGWYVGYINVPSYFPPEIVGGLSPDKQFFGAYVGDIGMDAWPEDFWFLLMSRQ